MLPSSLLDIWFMETKSALPSRRSAKGLCASAGQQQHIPDWVQHHSVRQQHKSLCTTSTHAAGVQRSCGVRAFMPEAASQGTYVTSPHRRKVITDNETALSNGPTCVEHNDGEGQHVGAIGIVEPAGVVLAVPLHSTAQQTTQAAHRGDL